ncbi:MAG: kinase [Solirubrobacteraceae bacterium]|nr:kinase [Solirubrobacteraceae bacterium]
MTSLQDADRTTTTAAPSGGARLRRVGLVVHPKRPIDGALQTAREWAQAHGAEIVQVADSGQHRKVAEEADAASCDLVLALGGDGTTLAALHAAARADRPVLGVACGSLGALTAVSADELRDALERVAAGDWIARALRGLRVTGEDGAPLTAINDVVIVRRGASQVAIEVRVDDELYARFAGDGLVVATPLGSSAYTMAAGGPIVAPGSDGYVLTPLAPHGGCCPPLVVGRAARATIVIEPGHAGSRIEVDGQVSDLEPRRLTAAVVDDYATLVGLGDTEPMITGLRRRKVIIDSPRMLARDEREALGGALGS